MIRALPNSLSASVNSPLRNAASANASSAAAQSWRAVLPDSIGTDDSIFEVRERRKVMTSGTVSRRAGNHRTALEGERSAASGAYGGAGPGIRQRPEAFTAYRSTRAAEKPRNLLTQSGFRSAMTISLVQVNCRSHALLWICTTVRSAGKMGIKTPV